MISRQVYKTSASFASALSTGGALPVSVLTECEAKVAKRHDYNLGRDEHTTPGSDSYSCQETAKGTPKYL